MHKHFLLTGKPEKLQSYSSDISSGAPSLAGVMDDGFIANVKTCFPLFPCWHISILVSHNTSWRTDDNGARMRWMAPHPSWPGRHCHQLGRQQRPDQRHTHSHRLAATERTPRARVPLPVQHQFHQLLSTCQGKAYANGAPSAGVDGKYFLVKGMNG